MNDCELHKFLHFPCHDCTLYCSPFEVYTLNLKDLMIQNTSMGVKRSEKNKIFLFRKKVLLLLHYFLNESKRGSNSALGKGWETLRVDSLRRCSLFDSCKGRAGTGGTQERVSPEAYLSLSLSYKNGGIGIKISESRAN